MTDVRPDQANPPVHVDEITAIRGARWVTAASLTVGAVNYGYALLLTRLLDADSFAVFAAGQGLLLCAATVAVVAIPWVLAQALARASSDAARGEAVRFAVVIGTTGGIAAGAVVAVVAAQFASAATTAVLSGATLLIYVTRVTVGWLQGTERMRTLACVTTSEAVLKLAVGLALVSSLGLGEAGALAAFGIAVLPFLIWWPYQPLRGGRGWLGATAPRCLWQRALELGAIQGLVALIAAMDIVLVALLPADGTEAASYQTSVMVGRAPLFLAGAISLAFFPALSRRSPGTPLADSAVRMYLTVAIPLTAVCATAPEAVLTTVFPPGYSMMGSLVAFTAISGFAVGGINLAATFFQAVNDRSCLRRQTLGLLVFVVALLIGWAADGVRGLAIGGACGAVTAMLLLAHRLARVQGLRVFASVPLLEPLLVIGVLLALRPLPAVWLFAATATGAYSIVRFLRHRADRNRTRVSRSRRDSSGIETSGKSESAGSFLPAGLARSVGVPRRTDPVRLLVGAVWLGNIRPAGDDELRKALDVARHNQVEGLLARAYPRQLAETLTAVEAWNAIFRRNLHQAAGRLRDAGIPALLIKADAATDHMYGNFDLVVPTGQWRAADAVLSEWGKRRSTHWLERSTTVLLEPPHGPAAHLHSSVSWFGIPVMQTDRLLSRAVPADGRPWLVPCPADQLRIWLAQGLFRNLSLDLSELLAIRPLLQPSMVAAARDAAAREGWAAAERQVLERASHAIHRLDGDAAVQLPVPLPLKASLHVATQHTRHLFQQGRGSVAAREAALRPLLVIAKSRRLDFP